MMKFFRLDRILPGDEEKTSDPAADRADHGVGSGRGASDRFGSDRVDSGRGAPRRRRRVRWPGRASASDRDATPGRGATPDRIASADRAAMQDRVAARDRVAIPDRASLPADGGPDDRSGSRHTERTKPAEPPSPPGSPPDPEAAYAYGVADGRREMEPAHFRSYLRHSLAEEEIDAKLAEVEERERALEARRTNIRQEREESAARAVAAEELRERIAGSAVRLEAIEGELEAAEEERKRVRRLGLLTHAMMFGAAALSFILADIVITRTIVADALALTGRLFLGIDEAWFFASALALLAVLLKPAYDRLVEARYWEGDRRGFTGAILVASGLALATLFVLGMFRAVAFEAQTLQELALQAPGAEVARQWTELRDLQANVVASWWGKLAFVMSGILFAVAGAICLGIGLRHFHDFVHVRHPLGRRRRKLRRERKRLAKARKKDAAALTEARAALRRAEVRLGDLPGLERIREDLQAAREERRELLARRTNIRRDRLESLYADGYGLGEWLGEPTSTDGPHPKRPRPYMAVRRSIRTALEEPDREGRRGPGERDSEP